MQRPAPLVILVHGIDGCKEEHLATELAMVESGLTVLAFDGAGQAEAFLLDKVFWTPRFNQVIFAAIDAVQDHDVDTTNIGVMGMSIGALWAFEAASKDDRISAVYDLDAPINTEASARIPFIIKSKLCQTTCLAPDFSTTNLAFL